MNKPWIITWASMGLAYALGWYLILNYEPNTKIIKTLTCYYESGDTVAWQGSNIEYRDGAFYVGSTVITGNCVMSQGEKK